MNTAPPPLPKKPPAAFHHPLGFDLYDRLAMDLHAMAYAEPMLKDIERLRHLLNELLAQLGERDRGDGNAPGHCHDAPGVWDSDNGKLAGKPCAWCALWAEAKATLLPPNA